MKKKLFILVFTLTSFISFCQTIQSLNVSPSGTDSVDINLEIFYHQYIEYLSYDYTITGNDIFLNACYHHAPANVPVTDFRTFNIPVNNSINYTLYVTVYRSIDLNNCDYNSISDTATLQFTTPLTETVYLGIENFESIENQIIIYPNPVMNSLNFCISENLNINSIKLYSILGKKTNRILDDYNKINVSHLSNGIYFVIFDTDKGLVKKKILIIN